MKVNSVSHLNRPDTFLLIRVIFVTWFLQNHHVVFWRPYDVHNTNIKRTEAQTFLDLQEEFFFKSPVTDWSRVNSSILLSCHGDIDVKSSLFKLDACLQIVLMHQDIKMTRNKDEMLECALFKLIPDGTSRIVSPVCNRSYPSVLTKENGDSVYKTN